MSDQILPLSALLPDPQNANSGTERGREVLRKSLEKFGAGRSVLLDGKNRLIAGNKATQQAIAAGLEEALVIETDGSRLVAVKRSDLYLDDPKTRELAFFDNRSSELDLAWSVEAIDAALQAEIDLSALWTGDELEELLRGLEPGGLVEGVDPDAAIENAPARAKPGEIWKLGNHRVGCVDSTDPEAVARLLEGKQPMLMATDPPFGVNLDPEWRDGAGHNEMARAQASYPTPDGRADWREAYALSGATVAYVWHADRFSSVIVEGLVEAGYDIKQQIIWVKTVHTMSRTSYHFKHEPCWYAVKKGKTIPWHGSMDQTTVWEAAPPRHIMSGSTEQRFDHPCQKPVELYRKPILNHTRPGDLVYDAFLGSGTALAAAEETGRVCYGCELAPQYVDIILARWESLTGKMAQRIS